MSFRVDSKNERVVPVDINERFDVTGVTRNEAGEAIPAAKVLLIFKSWPDGRYQQDALETKTDKDGRFCFPKLHDSGERTALLVTIVQDGYAMQSQYLVNEQGAQQDFKFALRAAAKLKLKLAGEDGKPLADAAVVPNRRTTAGGNEHAIYHQSGPSIAQPTGADGRIDLNLFEAGDSVDLTVTHQGVSSKVSFKVGDAPEQVVRVAAASADQDASGRWEPEAHAASAEQVAWIRRSAIPLKSIDPADEDFSDLVVLKKLIGDARIVQLGEQSHGDGTCFETKTRLIKFLHQEMGFDVLAFESGLFDCRKAWQAFRQGQPAAQAAGQGIFSIWTGSRQVQPLLEYLAARANSDRPLELCGFDCQFTAFGSRDCLVSDLRELVDELGITDPPESELKAVYAGLEQLLKRSPQPPEGQAAFLAALDSLTAALREKNNLTDEQTHEVLFWRQNLTSIKAHATERRGSPAASGINARDAQMAKNLVWLANDFYKDRKIIVWGASFHILRNPAEIEVPDGSVNYEHVEPMGHHVAQQLGDDVFTIGFTAYDGTAGAFFRPRFAIGKAPEGTLEGICHSAELTNAIIPLHGLDGGGEWLNEKQHSRPLGYTWMKARWPRHFDALCFNRTMHPSRRQ